MKSGKATRAATYRSAAQRAKARGPAVPQVWGHRFKEQLDPTLAGFLASIGFDRELAWADIAGSIAHATMLGRTGLITKAEADRIVAGLRKVWKDVSSGKAALSVEHEDIHMNVEALLKAELGDVAGLLHTGRSRNDQVALDLRIYVREHVVSTVSGLLALQDALLEVAERELGPCAVVQGHTHLQPAQPVLVSHVLLAYVAKLQRDMDRLIDAHARVNVSPLGAGALAGSGLDTDPSMVAELLGFEGTFENSLDAVSDRDFVFEVLSCLAQVSIHLSSLSEELIIWCSGEVGWAKVGDDASTGSSMMPQKKNPDVLELVRGKTGRVLGHLTAMGTVLKGLPLAYNKDLQEDKEATFDAFATVEACLDAMVRTIPGIRFDHDRMEAAVSPGSSATDLCEFLVKKGVPFREAHAIIGKLVLWCEENGLELNGLELGQLKKFHKSFDGSCIALLTPQGSVKAKVTHGSTGPAKVAKALEATKARAKDNHSKEKVLAASTLKTKSLLS